MSDSDHINCSLPGSSVHRILQTRILEWVAISYSRDLPNPGIEPASLWSPALACEFFATRATGKPNILNMSLKEKNLCPLDLIFKFSKTVLHSPPNYPMLSGSRFNCVFVFLKMGPVVSEKCS